MVVVLQLLQLLVIGAVIVVLVIGAVIVVTALFHRFAVGHHLLRDCPSLFARLFVGHPHPVLNCFELFGFLRGNLNRVALDGNDGKVVPRLEVVDGSGRIAGPNEKLTVVQFELLHFDGDFGLSRHDFLHSNVVLGLLQ